VGTVDTPGSAEGVAVGPNGLAVYVADSVAGLQEVNVADPALARLTRNLDTPGVARDVAVVSRELLALADGGSGLRLVQVTPPPSIDFNGDGVLDGLWRDASNGQVAGVLYNTFGGRLGTRFLGGDTDWSVVTAGDFDGDMVTDLIWYQVSSGRTVLTLLEVDGSSRQSRVLSRNGSWQVEATGDYDNDGRTDLVWREQTTATNIMWLMDGIASTEQVVLGGDADWRLVSTDPRFDANADGTTDLIWRQASTGITVVHRRQGTALLSATPLGGNADWEIAGTGDFDDDGYGDVLWRQASTGVVIQWRLVDAILQQAAWMGGDLNWSVVGTDDLTRDGRNDIIWREATTGALLGVIMDGASSGAVLPLGGDLSWSILRRPGRRIG
jgi:hypothetical protein